jgi:hypothetical protein
MLNPLCILLETFLLYRYVSTFQEFEHGKNLLLPEASVYTVKNTEKPFAFLFCVFTDLVYSL